MDEKDFELLEVLDETRNITHAARSIQRYFRYLQG